MPPRPRDDKTLDLFGWEDQKLPELKIRVFPEPEVRAGSLRAKFARVVALALKDCGKTRETIAEEISAFLGEEVTKNMIDAYAAVSREEHSISVHRLLALVQVTGDMRILQAIVEPFGHVAVPARYMGAIEYAMLQERLDETKQAQALAKRKWRGGL